MRDEVVGIGDRVVCTLGEVVVGICGEIVVCVCGGVVVGISDEPIASGNRRDDLAGVSITSNDALPLEMRSNDVYANLADS